MGRDRIPERRMSALSWLQNRSQTHFFRNFFEVNFLDDFLMDFYRTFIDFETILGRFWEGFGTIFRRFSALSSKTPIFKIRAPTQCFVRVELLKIIKKSMQNRCKFWT